DASEFVSHLLDERLETVQLSSAERRLAVELIYGVVRRRATLNAILKPNIKRKWENVEPELQTMLQLGVYQLVILSGIPAHAAVNETTALARHIGKPQWTGFVNGILRSVSRTVT